MKSCFPYYAWVLYHHECLSEEYNVSFILKMNEYRNAVLSAVIPIWSSMVFAFVTLLIFRLALKK